jgi:hypothetical protein
MQALGNPIMFLTVLMRFAWFSSFAVSLTTACVEIDFRNCPARSGSRITAFWDIRPRWLGHRQPTSMQLSCQRYLLEGDGNWSTDRWMSPNLNGLATRPLRSICCPM